jgi:two-component system LytT family sensor kinase
LQVNLTGLYALHQSYKSIPLIHSAAQYQIMRKSFVVLLNVGFWTCYVMVILIMLLVYYRSNVKADGNTSIVWNAFVSISIFAMFPSLISYLLFYHVLFPRYLQQGKIFQAVIAGLLIAAVAAAVGYILLRYFIETGRIEDMDEGGKYGRSTALRVIMIMTVIGIIFGIVGLVIKGFITCLTPSTTLTP